MGITKKQIQFIRSLNDREVRNGSHKFVAEGEKIISDLVSYFCCDVLVGTSAFLSEDGGRLAKLFDTVCEVSAEELKRCSQLKTPQPVLAVFSIPDVDIMPGQLSGRLTLMLDDVQNPGNMGTIVRIADWFGINQIICSPDTVDVYNPKVVQASMGAISRVKVFYRPLDVFLGSLGGAVPVYGTFLEGENIYKSDLGKEGIIVMGNEGNGISKALERYINHKIFIPSFPQGRATSESLNVAVATAVACSEFCRRML